MVESGGERRDGSEKTKKEVKPLHAGEEVSHFPFLQSCPRQ